MLAWRVLPGQMLLHHGWGDEVVIYNDVSGATHLLDSGTMELLLALRDGSVTAAELADPGVQLLLQHLVKQDLVEAC